MAGTVENLLLEHLKAIQAEQSASRDRDLELLTRLGQLESMIAQIGKRSSSPT
jgi:hypothetical protein